MSKPKCPDCDAEMVFEAPFWYCETCDLEWPNEEVQEEESDDQG